MPAVRPMQACCALLAVLATLSISRPVTARPYPSQFPLPSFASSTDRLRTNGIPPPRQRPSVPSWQPLQPQPAPAAAPSSVLFPVSYGADPTGELDSTGAFVLAMEDLIRIPQAAGARYLSDRVVDLAGITLDLQGGQYLLSKPLVFPPGYGNYRITRGTLRASANFTATAYSSHLLHIGNATGADVFDGCGQCSWGQFVTASDLLLDGGNRAGGLYISGIMGAVLTRLYVMKFVESGVSIRGGHEVQLLQAWFGVELWRETEVELVPPQLAAPVPLNATAGVRVVGFDNDLIDIVVFGTPVGVYVQGACNVLDNVHTWNGSPNGIVFDGDIPGSSSAGSNRVLNSYLDFSNLVLVNPHQMVADNNFFLGGGHIVLLASPTATNPRSISGLTLTNSQYNGPYTAESIALDTSLTAFHAVQDVTIRGAQYDAGYMARSTSVRVVEHVQLSGGGDGVYCVDLSDALLFDQLAVQWAQLTWRVEGAPQGKAGGYGWVVTDGLPTSLSAGDMRGVCLQATPATAAWNSTIYLEVDQSPRSQTAV